MATRFPRRWIPACRCASSTASSRASSPCRSAGRCPRGATSPPRRLAFDVGVDVRDLAALLLFTPAAMPAGDGGALAAHGQVRLAAGEGTKPSAEFVVTEARLDARDRPGLVHSASDFRVSLANDRIVLGDVHAVGEGVDLRLHGSLDLAAEKPTVDAKVTGSADATLLALAMPDLGLTGRLSDRRRGGGPLRGPGLERVGPDRERPIPRRRLCLRRHRGRRPPDRLRRRNRGPAREGRRRRSVRGRQLPAGRRCGQGFPPDAPGAAGRRAGDSGDAPDRGRRSRRCRATTPATSCAAR